MTDWLWMSFPVAATARKHGISDEDILHACRNAIRRIRSDDDLAMLIGPARNGSPLEVGVLDPDGDDPVAIHAMPLRERFFKFLGSGR